MPHPKKTAFGIAQNLQRPEHFLEIIKRLSHPHINQIINRVCSGFNLVNLVCNLRSRQIPLELDLAGGTK